MQKTTLETPTVERNAVGSKNVEQVCDALDVSLDQGLSDEEADQRREQYGANRLKEAQSRSTGQIFIEQFESGIVVMLVAAVVLSLAFGDFIEAAAIAVVIIVNGLIGFFTEVKAVRSMEALQELGSVETTVYRDGQARKISAEELVPGDIVLLDSGDMVTADLRLFEASKMQADESALTGESVPVNKQTEPIEEEVPLAEQANMVFKGTAITRGSGKGVVVSTGMNTELGKISSLVEEAEQEVTPLEKRLDTLGHKLIWVTIIVAALVGLSGAIAGKELFLMIETAIALAIAAIPEGLPIVATIALARGMRRMAKRNALMNKLSSVETLGATTIICTDKTGTLTENRMTVTRVVLDTGDIEVTGEALQLDGEFLSNDDPMNPHDHELLRQALELGVLCNNASLSEASDADETEPEAIGDPMEVALLVAGAKAEMRRQDLLEQQPEVREVAFESATKMMATYHEHDEGYRVAVKGAPEAVLDVCSHIRTEDGDRELAQEEREQWSQRNTQMAEEGLRLLAVATKIAQTTEEAPYQDLHLVGFLGLLDPPRSDVQEAIQLCQDAGIRVIMVTGDQIVTAKNVGQAVGLIEGNDTQATEGKALEELEDLSDEERQRLLDVAIFARVSPKQKLNLVDLYQQHGQIVAMTGDGVNDAPALEKADIGIAMGKHGTQVAREAADMILQDDAFSTIIEAVRYGRVIFGNIRKFVTYLLSGNAGEILIVGVATLFNAPLPILPLQILFLNFVADVFPALALGVGVGTQDVMHHPPRDPDEPVMTRRHWLVTVGYGVLIAAAVLTAYLLSYRWLGLESNRVVTISFLTLAIGRMWHVFNMREADSPVFKNDVTTNPWVWGALGLCFVLILSAIYLPGLSLVLRTVYPTFREWQLILGMSLVPLVIIQGIKIVVNWMR
ncbi:HAD-IC family P-type ATPase [candidate division KSB3 bacterium]|uniref:HAD-IC family P-type ATPase n=1 Tax=candidate division KSB3 bacterium TaxID=2044937 RepID=A0A9D5JXQ4_9BACT|nr:HAD-IC family P-type ATPase [candidate division KSB3 bacterium]MBD3325762.1 HAD-IC family P-type ATPase [candidate division KSB3 bacterium]